MFEMRYNRDADTAAPYLIPVEPALYNDRAIAEAALRGFAKLQDLDVHIHPGTYSEGSVSTAFRKGGDMLLDMVAVLNWVPETVEQVLGLGPLTADDLAAIEAFEKGGR